MIPRFTKSIAMIVGSLVSTMALASDAAKPVLFPIARMGPVPGKPIEEHLVTVTGKPNIHAEKDYSLLVFPVIDGRPIKVLFLPHNHYPLWEPIVSKFKDKKLTFTIWQTKRVAEHDDAGNELSVNWESAIETIQDGNQVIYDARICELHKTVMKRVELRVTHGLPAPEFFEAQKNFPHGVPTVLGGCVSMGYEEKEMAYQCDQCVAAYKKWEQGWLKKLNKNQETTKPPTMPVDGANTHKS